MLIELPIRLWYHTGSGWERARCDFYTTSWIHQSLSCPTAAELLGGRAWSPED